MLEKDISARAGKSSLVAMFLMTALLVFPLEMSFTASLRDFVKEKENIETNELTEKASLHPILVMNKVNRFCRLLQQKGAAAFKICMNKESAFFDHETYIFAHTLVDAEVMASPMDPEMVGKNILFMQDIIGKLYIAEMNRMVKENKAGWIEYYYRKTSEEMPIVKTAYARECRVDGRTYVIACGIENITKNQVLKVLQDLVPEK